MYFVSMIYYVLFWVVFIRFIFKWQKIETTVKKYILSKLRYIPVMNTKTILKQKKSLSDESMKMIYSLIKWWL